MEQSHGNCDVHSSKNKGKKIKKKIKNNSNGESSKKPINKTTTNENTKNELKREENIVTK